MKVAIVHDWIVNSRGGEFVLSELAEIYPDADIYTMFFDRRFLPSALAGRRIYYPKSLNFLRPFRKLLLPFMPTIIESFRLEGYDLVISSSSCVAKGVIPGPRATHVSYVHSPMRYIWDQRDHYLKTARKIPVLSWIVEFTMANLRQWDTMSSARVDSFVANSTFVSARIQKYYRRDSAVIHPPVDISYFSQASVSSGSNTRYFLVAGEFVGYKCHLAVVDACRDAGIPLVVAGNGPLKSKIESALGKESRLVISPSRSELRDLLAGCQALVMPNIEDFGILGVEALACGVPIIARHGGGAEDYVIDGKTGVFFGKDGGPALGEVLAKFDRDAFDRSHLKEFAKTFSIELFRQRFDAHVTQAIERNRGTSS